jgi:hypothetical protein
VRNDPVRQIEIRVHCLHILADFLRVGSSLSSLTQGTALPVSQTLVLAVMSYLMASARGGRNSGIGGFAFRLVALFSAVSFARFRSRFAKSFFTFREEPETSPTAHFTTSFASERH